MNHKFLICNIFLLPILVINLYSKEEDNISIYADFKKSNYSIEELGYNKCDQVVFKDSKHYSRDFKYPSQDADITPENFKYSLMSKMCYYPNNIYQYHEDVNFDDAVTSFLNEFKSQLPNCQNNKIKDQCFGYGLYHSGLYLGEWVNNYPHGKGIALITNNFPVMRRSSKEVNKEALYKGDFKNGYPHGFGYYNDTYHQYEGSWINGERHGEVGWITPSLYMYGIYYERDAISEYITITSVTKGSSAESNNIKAGDLITAFQLHDGEKITNTNLISFQKFGSILKASQKIIIYLNNNIEDKIYLEKSTIKTSFKNISACSAEPNKEHGCFEKALLKNEYFKKNMPYKMRGSFYMGYAHMYHNSDLHAGTLFDSQDDKYLQLYCYGATRPMLESNLDPKKNPVPLDGYPNIYVPRNFDEAPCGYGTMLVYPELIIENDVLLDLAWKEVKANTTNLIKIDFIEILENAIERKNNLTLFDPSLEKRISNPNAGSTKILTYQGSEHELCLLSMIISKRACYYERTKQPRHYLNKIREKVVTNPLTEAYQTAQSIKLDRAKYNVASLYFCKEEWAESPNYSDFNDCVYNKIFNSTFFWKCKYFGYSDYECLKERSDFRFNYDQINNYIDSHPQRFDNIDYNQWVFGKELEL